MTTKAERQHMDRVARMGCMLCRVLGHSDVPANLHHIREGQGMSQRSSHYLVIPLCKECHQGKLGIHGDKTLMRIAKVEELDLLAMVIEQLKPA